MRSAAERAHGPAPPSATTARRRLPRKEGNHDRIDQNRASAADNRNTATNSRARHWLSVRVLLQHRRSSYGATVGTAGERVDRERARRRAIEDRRMSAVEEVTFSRPERWRKSAAAERAKAVEVLQGASVLP